MKVLCALTQYNYGLKARGVSIEYASFLPALRSMGHEVLHFETWDSARYPTYRDLNNGLLQAVDKARPDLIFTVQRDYEIWLETLEVLAERHGIPLVTWITDDSFKFNHYSRFIGAYYDAVGTTYDYRLPDYQAAGIDTAFYTQWAANEQWLQPPKPANQCSHKVTFIGTNYGGREELIRNLRNIGVDITCFGFGWPAGPIATEQIPQVMRDSVISLNFSGGFRSDGIHNRQLKARTFEVPGAGGFLLSEHAPSIEDFYQVGEEIDVFHNAEELKNKIAYYLHFPEVRDRVAAAGYVRTRGQHLYRFRLSELFAFALRNHAMREQRYASLTNKAVPAVRNSQEQLLNTWEQFYRSALIRTCRTFFGPARGIKAARRFTFEASVRLLGSQTFTSKGYPGRLFPYV